MLEKTKKKLEKLGYISHLRIINKEMCIYSSIEGNINSVFFVRDKSQKYLIEYFTGQIPIEKQFETEEELINYIQHKFPVIE